MPFKFEDLKVWQKALELSFEVHELTLKFPKEELYVLTSQMKRAADSIALNISEGSTGQSNAEFSRFLGYAVRSSIEVVGCLYVGKRRGIVSEVDFKRLYQDLEVLVKMLQSLRNSLS